MKLKDILQFLKETYCGTIGVEYMYMTDVPQKKWVQERLESIRSRPNYDAQFKKHILERLTAAETLEKYMHTRYVGQKRFSGEGGESLVPQLDLLLQNAGKAGVQVVVEQAEVYVVGGLGPGGALNDVWSFDGVRWTKEAPRGTAPRRRGAMEGAVVTGPAMLVVGGTTGPGNLADFWELSLL